MKVLLAVVVMVVALALQWRSYHHDSLTCLQSEVAAAEAERPMWLTCT